MDNISSNLNIIHSFAVNSGGKDQEEDEDSSDNEDLAEADEDESDLDLAWKMLDVARAISEKQSGDSMEKVDILSTLAEVSLERGLWICLLVKSNSDLLSIPCDRQWRYILFFYCLSFGLP